MSNRKTNNRTRREMRTLRIQQLVFVAIGLIVILSMVLSLVAN